MESSKFKIAFGSKSKTGKDYAANILQKNFSFDRMAFAEPLYKICGFIQATLEEPIEKDRELLQSQGESIKKVKGRDVWAKKIEKQILRSFEHERSVVITDLRFKEEWDMLLKYGFLKVRINRKDRPITGPVDHISEIDLDNHVWDVIIENDKGKEEFKEKVLRFYEDLVYRKVKKLY